MVYLHTTKATVDLIKFNNYSILAIDNIDKKVFENIISNLKIDSIESNLYHKYRNDMINTTTIHYSYIVNIIPETN